jgi:hypothetical protein
MALIFTAPDEFDPYVESLPVSGDPVKVFLAGGITGCENWQKTVIDILEKDLPDDVLIYNPRREEFDTESRISARAQIEWEFRHLEEMDIFTMFFAASNTSVGPICLYELGRYIPRMQMRFPTDWQNRIVIGIEAGYSRQLDVIEQVDLATGLQVCPVFNFTPEMHAERIKQAVRKMMSLRMFRNGVRK